MYIRTLGIMYMCWIFESTCTHANAVTVWTSGIWSCTPTTPLPLQQASRLRSSAQKPRAALVDNGIKYVVRLSDQIPTLQQPVCVHFQLISCFLHSHLELFHICGMESWTLYVINPKMEQKIPKNGTKNTAYKALHTRTNMPSWVFCSALSVHSYHYFYFLEYQ